MEPAAEKPGFRTFLLIWFGQFISLIGSGLTGFALGVWVYQRTGSVTQFALISLVRAAPVILVSPLAGALVDRMDRRLVLIVSDLIAGLSTLAIALLFAVDRLDILAIYVIVGLKSICDGFRGPALNASTVMLVDGEQLGRANGITLALQAASQILPPVVAGVLVLTLGLGGVLLIDFATFLFAVFTALLVRIPRPKPSDQDAAQPRSVLHTLSDGGRYIAARPGLLGLLLVFAVVNYLLGNVSVLVTPLVLSVGDTAALGAVLSVGGVGMLIGSLLMSVWGGPARRMNGVLGFMLLSGVFVSLAGVRPLVPLFFVAAFGFFFCLALLNSCFWTIWQSRIAPDMQGRVFGTIQMIASLSLPMGYVTAGPLADKIFEPLLKDGGALAESVGRIIGVGSGRGISLMFIVMGALLTLTTIAAFLNPRVRLLEDEMPQVERGGAASAARQTPQDDRAILPEYTQG